MSKVRLRKFWFQIHKWIGLILAAAIIPICLTGAVLVWQKPLARIVYPDRFAVSRPAVLPPERYAAAARAALAPGERLTRLILPAGPGEPVELWTVEASVGDARPERGEIYLDPADARVIEKRRISTGIFQIMHILHGSLMVPEIGRKVVGWIGIAMTLSSLTGLWLWWPITGSVRRGFRWKRHPNMDTNLHYLLGFWISVPLFVLSMTGVWISFPQLFARFDGMPPVARQGQPRPAIMRQQPIDMPVTPIGLAVAQAQAVAPGALRSVTFPTDVTPTWTVDLAIGSDRTSVAVADSDGAATPIPVRAQRETLARTMRRIHDGQGMPLWWQGIIVLGGLLPVALAITGMIMWWRARHWRATVARRRGRTVV